jgi:hypothetical protein
VLEGARAGPPRRRLEAREGRLTDLMLQTPFGKVSDTAAFAEPSYVNFTRCRRVRLAGQCSRSEIGIASLSFREINDPMQPCINTSTLDCLHILTGIGGPKMQAIEKIPSEVVPASASKFLVNALAVICGLGVLVFICMATSGLDMSAGFF